MSIERKVKEVSNRILILGDSLSFSYARHGQRLEDSWPSQIKARFPDFDVWQRCRPGTGILQVGDELNLFLPFIKSFSHVVIHVGITDLCPRPFPHIFQAILVAYGRTWLRRTINQHYRMLLKIRSKPWVAPREFSQKLNSIFTLINQGNPDARIAVITIPVAGPRFVKRVPDIGRHIEEYNSIIREQVGLIEATKNVALLDPYRNDSNECLLLPDGHHFSLRGHTLVAQSVGEFLLK